MDISSWETDTIYKPIFSGVSVEGNPIFSSYEEIKCRVQFSTKKIMTATQEDYISSQQIVSTQSMFMGDKLWLDKEAADNNTESELRKIKRVDKAYSKDESMAIYVAYL